MVFCLASSSHLTETNKQTAVCMIFVSMYVISINTQREKQELQISLNVDGTPVSKLETSHEDH